MDYHKNYQKWIKYVNLEETLKNELKTLDEKEIEDAFYKDIEFGTGGIRGLMGPGTNRVNLYTIMRSTRGFGEYILTLNGTKKVAISYDNRLNSFVFVRRAAAVLASMGIKSYITKTLRPTPYLSFMTRYFSCDGGIMVTASHNPKAYNGYKVYDKDGCQLVPELADNVIKRIANIKEYFSIEYDENSPLIEWVDASFDSIYLERVKKIELERFDDKPLKLVYSPLHGAGGPLIPRLLTEMGYKVFPLESQMIVDSAFSNTASSNPEEQTAYEGSLSYAKEINADLIMVTDPDADRLGIMVKHNNVFVFLTGNQAASLTLHYILSRRKAQNILPKNGYVFTTNVTTPLIEKITNSFGLTLKTTLTGFKFIGQQAKEIEPIGTYIFGCEESYGSLISDFVRDKDAVQAVYMLAEMATFLNKSGKTLIDYLDDLYKQYGYYMEETLNIGLTGIEGLAKINKIMKHFRDYQLSIKNKELVQIDDCLKGTTWTKTETVKLDLPSANVLKFYYRDGSWVVFRPSGTEPKLKIYLSAKAGNKSDAQDIIENYKQVIMGLVSQI